MQLCQVSVRPCAFTLYCVDDSWCRMSNAMRRAVTFPFRKERDSEAFHTRSSVFIIDEL